MSRVSLEMSKQETQDKYFVSFSLALNLNTARAACSQLHSTVRSPDNLNQYGAAREGLQPETR